MLEIRSPRDSLSGGFRQRIAPHVWAELQQAGRAEASGDALKAFSHLENAHVLGQASTYWHVRVHWRMFRWGWRQQDVRELRGQVLRLIGAATKTAIGRLPQGNTGGAHVSAFQPMPIEPRLAQLIAAARR